MLLELVFVNGVIMKPKRYDMRHFKNKKQIIKNFRLFIVSLKMPWYIEDFAVKF